ncbi:unnamed protein product [Cercospora beticola]|nr:unnamed protein product [Cercospora beticola]
MASLRTSERKWPSYQRHPSVKAKESADQLKEILNAHDIRDLSCHYRASEKQSAQSLNHSLVRHFCGIGNGVEEARNIWLLATMGLRSSREMALGTLEKRFLPRILHILDSKYCSPTECVQVHKNKWAVEGRSRSPVKKQSISTSLLQTQEQRLL